jgi:hypothetical protein
VRSRKAGGSAPRSNIASRHVPAGLPGAVDQAHRGARNSVRGSPRCSPAAG